MYQGNAKVQMGGEKGTVLQIKAGDVIIIPAGVGHKCLSHSSNFMVVGAYPNGMSPNLIKNEKQKYNTSVEEIKKVPLPKTDPLMHSKGLTELWK